MATGFGRGVRLGISPAISALILVGIAIAVSIAVGYFLFSQTQTMASKGATLQVTAEAHDAGNNYTAVTVIIKNTGPEDVEINSIVIRKQGSTTALSCTWTANPAFTTLKAGATASYSAICQGASAGQKISIFVDATTRRTGTKISASTTTEVQP